MIQEINHQNFELKIIIDELKQCQQNNSLKYYDANFKKAIKDLANSEDLDTLSTNNQLIEKQIEQIKLNENKTTILSIQQKIKGLYFCSNPKQDHENQNDQKSISIEENFRNIIHNFSNILEMLLNLNCINILIMNEVKQTLGYQEINTQLILEKLYQMILNSKETDFSDKHELQKRILEINKNKIYQSCQQNLGLFNKILEKVSLKDILFLISLNKKQRKYQIEKQEVFKIIQKDYESEKTKLLQQFNEEELKNAKIQQQQKETLYFESLLQQKEQLRQQLIQSEKSFKKAKSKDIKLTAEVINILVDQIEIAINKIIAINIS